MIKLLVGVEFNLIAIWMSKNCFAALRLKS
jgi:hypothetical protein